MSLKGRLRILWRDFVVRGVEYSRFYDEEIIGRLFLDSGTQVLWSSLDVHKTLLEDKVRVEAFQKGILESVKEGDTVLDVGTGMGILALLAARKAGKVVGVDSSNVIEYARETAEKNNIKNAEFIRSDIKDLKLPKVDAVIIELIGMGVIDEGIIQKASIARKFLKPGGKIIPSKIRVQIAPAESSDVGLGFWDRLYGLDYSSVDRIPHESRNFTATDKTRLLSAPQTAFSFDLASAPVKDVSSTLEFTVQEAGTFHGLICTFKLELSEKTVLDTSPGKPLTHWKHLFLPHTRREKVEKGDTILVQLKTKHRVRDWKWKTLVNPRK